MKRVCVLFKEPNVNLYKPALEILRTRIKESTSSMTSVPKPLKFLRNQYDTLKGVYEKISDKTTKVAPFFGLFENFSSFNNILVCFLSSRSFALISCPCWE